MVLYHILFYIVLCVALWVGSGLIVSAVDRFAHKLNLSPFSSSFFILGILTSLPEIAVGISAVTKQQPDIFVGNLLGGIPVLFLFIIPILAILGNGIRITHDLTPTRLLIAFVVIAAPSMFVLNGVVSNLEGVLCIVFYCVLFFILERTHGVMALFSKKQTTKRTFGGSVMFKICIGTVLIFFAGHYILGETMYLATYFGLSPFFVSLIVLSLGTNMPELSVALRSIVQKKKDIAFGDYMGSAAANTLLFGIYTLSIAGYAFGVKNSLTTFIFIAGGLGLFYFFSRTKKDISRTEGVLLLALYVLYIFFEHRVT